MGKTSAAIAPISAMGGPGLSRDRDVMARVARGEIEALRTVYDQHASRAMAIAVRILRSPQEAEDVVQDTFLEVWRRSAQFDGTRGSAASWVATIARSRAIDRLRVSGRTLGAVAEDLLPTEVLSPSELTEGRRDETRVATALAALPPEQRETILLAYFEGLSQSEIAVRTGSPLGTVKMRVRLAINKLGSLLKEDQA